jgi:hypothetical protein
MKAEFELNLDCNNKPSIKIRHFDKENSLDQRLLKLFLDEVRKKGCLLKHINSYGDILKQESWEDYEIQINDQ